MGYDKIVIGIVFLTVALCCFCAGRRYFMNPTHTVVVHKGTVRTLVERSVFEDQTFASDYFRIEPKMILEKVHGDAWVAETDVVNNNFKTVLKFAKDDEIRIPCLEPTFKDSASISTIKINEVRVPQANSKSKTITDLMATNPTITLKSQEEQLLFSMETEGLLDYWSKFVALMRSGPSADSKKGGTPTSFAGKIPLILNRLDGWVSIELNDLEMERDEKLIDQVCAWFSFSQEMVQWFRESTKVSARFDAAVDETDKFRVIVGTSHVKNQSDEHMPTVLETAIRNVLWFGLKNTRLSPSVPAGGSIMIPVGFVSLNKADLSQKHIMACFGIPEEKFNADECQYWNGKVWLEFTDARVKVQKLKLTENTKEHHFQSCYFRLKNEPQHFYKIVKTDQPGTGPPVTADTLALPDVQAGKNNACATASIEGETYDVSPMVSVTFENKEDALTRLETLLDEMARDVTPPPRLPLKSGTLSLSGGFHQPIVDTSDSSLLQRMIERGTDWAQHAAAMLDLDMLLRVDAVVGITYITADPKANEPLLEIVPPKLSYSTWTKDPSDVTDAIDLVLGWLPNAKKDEDGNSIQFIHQTTDH